MLREGAVGAGRWRCPDLEDGILLTFCVRWTEHRMSCPLRKREGSGYVKPTDAALAKANEEALAKLRAERAAQDAKLAAAWDPKPESDPKLAAGASKRYKMTGD